MDIFRILSRSTKLSKTPTNIEEAVPSNGQKANPQLFGKSFLTTDEERDGNKSHSNEKVVLGKRKRGEVSVIEALPKELDFFGDRDTGKEQKQESVSRSLNGMGSGTASSGLVTQSPEALEEREKRAILKSHKIKVTILNTPDGKVKKTGKKGIAEKTPQKNSRIQVFPEPLTSFSQLATRYSLSKRLLENVFAQGYKVPTEVQLAALPLLLGDPCILPRNDMKTQNTSTTCDLLTVAPTGSGKTLAFLIPVISAILRDRKAKKDERTQAVILAPTRELANQIVNEGRKLTHNTGIRISLMRKGMILAGPGDDYTSNDHESFLEDDFASEDDDQDDERLSESHTQTVVKTHIVVSTPLVLVNSLASKPRARSPLSELRYLVLDEADVLLDPLFHEQVQAIWDKCTSPYLRVTLWSATMASSIEELIIEQLTKLDHIGRVPILRLVVGLKDSALPTLIHTMTYTGTESGKLLAMRQLLHPTAPDTDSEGRKPLRPPFIVFTQTIERAKALQAELRYDIPSEAGGSARMAALHSAMSEKAREKVMADFRKGEIWVIITTDLLARGVDFRGLNGVVNYDIPTSAAGYIHRVGRTGRAGREGGVAVTFYTKEDIPYVKPIANVIAASEKLRGGIVSQENNMQQWLLESLPTPTKREKKELKRRGAETRRVGTKSALISTKSGYDRRIANRRRDIKTARQEKMAEGKAEVVSPDDFAGFSD